MKIVMCVSRDEYELPLAVADTQTEMAELWGCSVAKVNLSVHEKRNHIGNKTKHRFIQIEVDDD